MIQIEKSALSFEIFIFFKKNGRLYIKARKSVNKAVKVQLGMDLSNQNIGTENMQI